MACHAIAGWDVGRWRCGVWVAWGGWVVERRVKGRKGKRPGRQQNPLFVQGKRVIGGSSFPISADALDEASVRGHPYCFFVCVPVLDV